MEGNIVILFIVAIGDARDGRMEGSIIDRLIIKSIIQVVKRRENVRREKFEHRQGHLAIR
jgi:hypothetical protein